MNQLTRIILIAPIVIVLAATVACTKEPEPTEPEGESATVSTEEAPTDASTGGDETPTPELETPETDTPETDTPELSAVQLEVGKKVYQIGRCAQCHGEQGQGGQLGPDLTDTKWLRGDGSVASIREVLVAGVGKDQMIEKQWMLPMPSAKFLIRNEDDLTLLAQYIWSLSQ